MSRPCKAVVGICGILLSSHCLLAAETPEVGRELRADELRELDIDVSPDGAGLPEGRGTVKQGEAVYAAKCAACHGARGEGSLGPALAGGIGTLDSPAPNRTVGSYWPFATTLWDYTRRAMPYQNAGELENDEVYAVTAYVLFLNGVLDADAELNARSLPGVRMPNRDGFRDTAVSEVVGSWATAPEPR